MDSPDFYPRPPRGGRLLALCCCSVTSKFLSTPSARRATVTGGDLVYFLVISIHALREEGDQEPARHIGFCGKISIHALREEGDTLRRCGSSLASRFLSTPSARRATCPRFILFYRVQFLSTPSARRATHTLVGRCFGVEISIHALREEGDFRRCFPSDFRLDFYPRPPRGGRP